MDLGEIGVRMDNLDQTEDFELLENLFDHRFQIKKMSGFCPQ